MILSGITYQGPSIDDIELLERLPIEIIHLLNDLNGFIIHHGALHVRGACFQPAWHSLREAMHGERAFHKLYKSVLQSDIPFAQDCVGDQFLLRDGYVIFLMAETGEIKSSASSLEEFFQRVEEDPDELLNSAPDHRLEPGQLIHAYPPFCVKPSDKGYSLRACPAHEVIHFHADFARQIADIPDGVSLKIKIVKDSQLRWK